MRSDDLIKDVTDLSESLRLTFQLIARLSRSQTQTSSDKTDPQNDGTADVLADLTQDIQDNLRQHEDTYESIEAAVEDLTSSTGQRASRGESAESRKRVQLTAQVARLSEDLKHARGQFRKAQLTARRSIEAAKVRQREAYFASLKTLSLDSKDAASPTSASDLFAGRRGGNRKKLTEDELLINASSDVTRSLRRTHNLLTEELSRSRFAQETLDQSTAALAELSERYGNLDTLLSTSKNLLGTLLTSQKSDTWYLETAFYILIATLVWLVFRRIIYGPAWWFVWLPLRTFLLRPVWYILSVLGRQGAALSASLGSAAVTSTVSRASLRVQPSAVGGIPRLTPEQQEQLKRGVPVGAGGQGAKLTPGAGLSMSEQIGEMAGRAHDIAKEDVKKAENAADADKKDDASDENAVGDKEQVIRRGDGTILVSRDQAAVPPNPKKKAFDDNGGKDEL